MILIIILNTIHTLSLTLNTWILRKYLNTSRKVFNSCSKIQYGIIVVTDTFKHLKVFNNNVERKNFSPAKVAQENA